MDQPSAITVLQPQASPAARAGSASPAWLLRAAFVLLSIGAVIPLFCGRYLALVDLSRHATQVALWKAYATDPVVRQHYSVHLSSPYAAFYFLWRGFLELGWSLPDSGRLATALCVLAMPPSFLFLLKARQRPAEWMFFLFAFLYMDALAWGFLPFYLSLSVLFCGLALFTKWLRHPSWVGALLVFASGLFVMWSHALTVALWGVACGLFAVLEPVPWRRRLLALAPLVPVGVLLVLWTRASADVGAVHFWTGPGTRAARMGGYLFGCFVTTPLPVTRIGIFAAVGLLLIGVVQRWRSEPVKAQPVDGFDLPLLMAGLAALGIFFFVPDGIAWTWHLNTRFLATALLLLFASLAPPPSRPLRLGIAVALVAATVGLWISVGHAFRSFDGALGDAESLFTSIPPKAAVLRPQGSDAWLAPFGRPVLDHVAVWAQAYNLGPNTAFTDNRQALVQDSETDPWPKYEAALDRTDPQHWVIRPGDGLMPDYLIFFTAAPPPAELPVVGQPGYFRLWRRTGGLNAYRREGA